MEESRESRDDERCWYYQSVGDELGPLSFRELLDLAENGILNADDQVKCGGDGRYRAVASIGRLFAVLPYQEPTKIQRAHSPPVSAAGVPSAETKVPEAIAPALAAPVAAATLQYHPAAQVPAWFAWMRGVEYGPVSLLQLSQWYSGGLLAPTDFVKYGMVGGWLPPNPTIPQSLAQMTFAVPAAASTQQPMKLEVVPPAVAASSQAAPTAAPSVPIQPPAQATTPTPTKPVVPPPTCAATDTTPPTMSATSSPVAKAAQVEESQPAGVPRTASSAAPKVSAATTVAAGPQPAATAPVVTKQVRPTVPTPTTTTTASPVTAPIAAKPAVQPPPTTSTGVSAVVTSSRPAPAASPLPVSKPAVAAPSMSSGSGGGGFDIGGLLTNKTVIGVFAAVAATVVVAAGLRLLPLGSGGDQVKLEQLQQILSDFRRLRDEQAGADAWSTFTAAAEQTIKPMVDELIVTASRKRPERQYLLWAARNRWPEMVQSAREKPTAAEREFEKNLQLAAYHLGLGPNPDANQLADSKN